MQKIKETKWRWAGHIARTEDNRWTKRLSPTGDLGRENGGEDDRREGEATTSQCTWAQQHGKEWPDQETNRKI